MVSKFQLDLVCWTLPCTEKLGSAVET